MNQDDYDKLAADLDYLADVPDDVLRSVVRWDGLCFWAFDRELLPDLTGAADPDRALASWACAGCPVIQECLELELREAGEDTLGIWGALSDTDRRRVHRVWKWRHVNRGVWGGDDE
ncbi:transcription factor WhiB [Saccharomonospora sp. CUA-673]|uniref:WhiB family transcriptional regulator n=1 Tax=Saccharomonospora sp. CUA-673 TaxID=1904969 RepID=UPI0009617D94|nr:WhiB family transcriptional regulator [Saccharomonospora sp. CUA-673]OLT40549.1 transcription factor WhiB [Saccharomonospora sp. CUA-673]